MTDASEALFVIKLPAGQKTVPFEEIPTLIGIAVFEAKYGKFDRDNASEDDWLRVHLVGIDHKDSLKRAARDGKIEVLNPTTLRPLELAVGAMLDRAIVRVTVLREFVKGLNGEVELQQPTPKAQFQDEMSIGTIDWQFWRTMRKAKDWQACALSLDIDPDSLQHHPQGWMAGPDAGPIFTSSSFVSTEVEEKFGKRLRLLRANRYDRAVFTLPMAKYSNLGPNEVLLSEFVAWGLSIGWNDMPPGLAALSAQVNIPSAQPVQQPSPVVSVAEWDALVENEDAARQDPEYKAQYDHAMSLYDERDKLLEHLRQDHPYQDEGIKKRLSEIRKEIAESEAGLGAAAVAIQSSTALNIEKKNGSVAANTWDEYNLRRLWDESKVAGMTHQKLAEKYGVKRQRIGTLLARAKELFGPRKADPFDQLNRGSRKK